MSLLTKTYKPATLYRSTRASSTSAVVNTETTITGSFQPISVSETFRNGKGGADATHRFYTPMSTIDIFYTDKIGQDGQVYIIVPPVQPVGISGRKHHKEYLCKTFEV